MGSDWARPALAAQPTPWHLPVPVQVKFTAVPNAAEGEGRFMDPITKVGHLGWALVLLYL